MGLEDLFVTRSFLEIRVILERLKLRKTVLSSEINTIKVDGNSSPLELKIS